MPELPRVQSIELFHLAFLEMLSKRLDPSRYVLKGGANLRYFFGSVRYSEDIDLDLNPPLPADLEGKVNGILASRPLALLLRLGELSVAEFTTPKQTATTRRWKVALAAAGADPVRTKIEFSGRAEDGVYSFEPMPNEIVAPYALPSPGVQHYEIEAATAQKIGALAGRSETQARDVFDLDLLLRRRSLSRGEVDRKLLDEAAERALELPFDAYRDQVLPFLEPDALELYDGKAAWERMQTFVFEHLEAAS